ncbi:MAG: amidohydrolase [Chloroflexi bacterium]|nr:amidohydrolase [Chloroflexota bacterium]
MSAAAPQLVIRGAIVLRATPEGLELAEAIGIADGRVVAAGRRDDVPVPAGARVVDVGPRAVIPGLHDFHIHLVDLARSTRSLRFNEDPDGGAVAARVAEAAAALPPRAWIRGRGWSEVQLGGATPALEEATGGRPTWLMSHDGHSAWASAAARRLAGLHAATPDPDGGRIERDEHGEPTGVLRERAMDLVSEHVARVQGSELRDSLDLTLRALAGHGITGASEAGDYTDRNGVGADADLGDSASSLTDLGDLIDGRLRLSIGIPADAIAAAAARGLRTGVAVPDRRTLRIGWAKHYTDGALGSGTAALFGPGGEPAGILRVTPERLADDAALARPAGIGLALHAIGDRAIAVALDAFEGAPARMPGAPMDRIEHVQLLRPPDAPRFARAGVVASVQPIHAAADRDLVERHWAERADDAYAWRRLRTVGALLVAGSDAPVEDVDPWLGIHAAVHRRFPDDDRGDWRTGEGLTLPEALSAYTVAAAIAVGAPDEGHLRVGARADLAVLNADLSTVLRADDELASVHAELTLVDGREVPRS